MQNSITTKREKNRAKKITYQSSPEVLTQGNMVDTTSQRDDFATYLRNEPTKDKKDSGVGGKSTKSKRELFTLAVKIGYLTKTFANEVLDEGG